MTGISAPVFVEAKIAQRPVILFSKSYCPESKKIKQLLSGVYGLTKKQYEAVDIERRQDVNQIESYFMIKCLSERRELPQLWIDGSYVGNDFVVTKLHETGHLYELLVEAGVETLKPDHIKEKSTTSDHKTDAYNEDLKKLKAAGAGGCDIK